MGKFLTSKLAPFFLKLVAEGSNCPTVFLAISPALIVLAACASEKCMNLLLTHLPSAFGSPRDFFPDSLKSNEFGSNATKRGRRSRTTSLFFKQAEKKEENK
jgi:hypothetical protein